MLCAVLCPITQVKRRQQQPVSLQILVVCGHRRVSDEGMGRAVKNSLEIIIKQVRLEGGFKRGGRIRVAECLRQIVPDRWASIRKRYFTKCFCVYTGGDKDSCVRCRS